MHAVQFEKGSVKALHPEQTAIMKCQDKTVGYLGLLHPKLKNSLGIKHKLYLFEVELEVFDHRVLPQSLAISKFPSVRRDFAIVVEKSVSCNALITEIKAHAGENLQDIVVFDVYYGQNVGENEKSVAIGLILQDPCRTLNDEEVANVTQAVMEALALTFKAKLRDE